MPALPNTSVVTTGGSTSVCAISMFPSTHDFAFLFSSSFSFHSMSSLNMPGFSLPSPMLPNINAPSLESIYAAMTALSSMAKQAIMALIDKIASVLGMGIDAILSMGGAIFSGIYGFSLNVADVLACDIKKIAASIKAFFASGGHIPGLPSPLFPSMSAPIIEAYHVAQLMLTNFWLAVMSAVSGLVGNIKSFISNLQIPVPGVPTIPPIPSMPDISMAMFSLGGVPDFGALLKKFGTSLSALFDSVSSFVLAGFPFSIHIPDMDISSHFKSPSISGQLSIGMFMQDILSGIVKFVTGLVQTLLDVLGITIPNPFPICVSSPAA
jgi:hypothetical protein